MFEKIAIIGMGLIGSSIARCIKENNLTQTLVAIDIREDVCQKTIDLQLADYITDDPALGVEGADLVVLAVPVGAMSDVMRDIASALRDNVILTDTGSVKIAVIEAVRPFLREGMNFVPAHPIAGTEFSGPEFGFSELFHKRWCILTPMPETEVQAIEKVTNFWVACKSMIEIMDPAHHDLVLGITSHLPHLIAYTIVGTATELEEDIKSEVIKFSASGFRDFTRIAASDPTMWRDVFLNNKVAVLEVLQRFTEDLTALQKAIRQGDGDYLYQTFERTRGIRKAIIREGQAE